MSKFQHLIRLDEPCYDFTMDKDEADAELSYDRPPITEAVIERRFSTPLQPELLDSLRQRFEKEFPAVSQVAELAIAMGPDGSQPQMNQTQNGYRLVNREGTVILVLTNQAIAYARLAPYPGWASFSEGASTIFKSARDAVGYIPFSRIGIRYINRLDIPTVQQNGMTKPFPLEDYILVRPEFPENVFAETQMFTMQCIFVLGSIECAATINVASVPSPIPNHTSILFDIDIGRNSNVPQREEEIQHILHSIRHEKNRIFNSCLTSKMKDLFH